MNKRTEKVIWAAGFIDGEGYVGITRCKYNSGQWFHYRCQLSVGQIHRAPLDVLKDLFGGSISSSRDKYGFHWQWRVYGDNCIRALIELKPYLIVKSAQAELTMEFHATKSRASSRRSTGHFNKMDNDLHELRADYHARVMALNARRHRDRLSEEAPVKQDGAIVGSDGNSNHQSTAEMTVPNQTIN